MVILAWYSFCFYIGNTLIYQHPLLGYDEVIYCLYIKYIAWINHCIDTNNDSSKRNIPIIPVLQKGAITKRITFNIMQNTYPRRSSNGVSVVNQRYYLYLTPPFIFILCLYSFCAFREVKYTHLKTVYEIIILTLWMSIELNLQVSAAYWSLLNYSISYRICQRFLCALMLLLLYIRIECDSLTINLHRCFPGI